MLILLILSIFGSGLQILLKEISISPVYLFFRFSPNYE
jgi:hypothetical protein